MANTLLLDRTAWDLAIDASGNIAMASEPYSQTQDVASACRLFQGDAYYNQTAGVPYFTQVLGQFQPIQAVKSYLSDAALSVPGVASARVVLTSAKSRVLQGQVQITVNGQRQIVTL